MTAALSDAWRLPGCGDRCWPRAHSPEDHEQYGFWLGQEAMKPKVVATGRLVADCGQERVTVDGAPINLTKREWQVVRHLASRLDTYCSHHEVVGAVWGGVFEPERDGHLVRCLISRLRAKLGSAASLIQARPHYGYRLRREPPVEVQP